MVDVSRYTDVDTYVIVELGTVMEYFTYKNNSGKLLL